MRLARAHGFPAPEVISVWGTDLVLERVVGPTMRDDLERDASLLRSHAALLASLHERLHAITAPAWLPAAGTGDSLVHLDLHPDNVLMGRGGPRVIDWANAARGHWADDVATTYVILASVVADEPVRALARRFAEAFISAFDGETVRAHLADAIDRRVNDANLTDAERDAARSVIF